MFLRKNKRSSYYNGKHKRRNIIIAVCGLAVGLGLLSWHYLGAGEYHATVAEAKAALTSDKLADLQALSAPERKARLVAYGKAISADIIATRSRDGQTGPRNRQNNPADREVMEKLAPEDRDAFRSGMQANFRSQRQKEQDAKILAYFKASAEEKQKLLQEELDRQKKREEERKAADSANNNNRPRGNWGSLSRDQREDHMRERLNDTDPEMRALRQEYTTQLRNAAKSQAK